ncbi:hypothetical protein BDZ85DRAFT_111663 [Elsinoe ampelina]|uniref:Uncharacterized protein n=1 Tax=Elsinoe ampelina TaxID=302913 RepID=A0A6A6GCY8_9PEZI|nr:hypothetical protein BDZ85DRAFT_111663 [Elsinoe ampelina]
MYVKAVRRQKNKWQEPSNDQSCPLFPIVLAWLCFRSLHGAVPVPPPAPCTKSKVCIMNLEMAKNVKCRIEAKKTCSNQLRDR